MSSSRREPLREVPDLIVDPQSRKRYKKGKFMGKGGFARCYELTDLETDTVLAGKIVPKSLLVKQHSKEKMTQEISIHKTLKHQHVVQFFSFFEDSENVYILLELCRRRSLMELHKRRKAVTEPEARYFMRQIALGVKYLHDHKIIHRDLKLGNLFLSDEMDVKIGDLGLATRVDYDGERKRTLCGTPNYIAPEVICKKGHSYEVDVWSMGCILYTLLVGRPPFETSSLKDTYQKIKKNEYQIPPHLSAPAATLLKTLLADDPTKRPNLDLILRDNFFTCAFMPPRLPTSCLTMPPRFDKVDASFRAPSGAGAATSASDQRRVLSVKDDNEKPGGGEKLDAQGKPVVAAAVAAAAAAGGDNVGGVGAGSAKTYRHDEETESHLNQLLDQLNSAIGATDIQNELDAKAAEDDCEAPEAVPIFWVSKWVDYSDKYGLGYQLSDNSVGVLFNDQTRLLLLADGDNLEYIERSGSESYHTLKEYPEALTKKVTLLKYFRNYMVEHLLRAGGQVQPKAEDDMVRLPFLRSWFRTRSAIVLHLSNGTLQVNFFQDHSKIILEPTMSSVSYIDEARNFRVFRLCSPVESAELAISKTGASTQLMQRLKYAKTMVERLQSTRSTSSRVKTHLP